MYSEEMIVAVAFANLNNVAQKTDQKQISTLCSIRCRAQFQ